MTVAAAEEAVVTAICAPTRHIPYNDMVAKRWTSSIGTAEI